MFIRKLSPVGMEVQIPYCTGLMPQVIPSQEKSARVEKRQTLAKVVLNLFMFSHSQLTVSKDFSLSLDVPSYLIRGEEIVLEVKVINHLEHNIEVWTEFVEYSG